MAERVATHPAAAGAEIVRMEPAAAAATLNSVNWNRGQVRGSVWDAAGLPAAAHAPGRWGMSGIPLFPWTTVTGTPENLKTKPRRDNPWAR